MSTNTSREVAEAALSTGADGYVVKSGGASELLTAVKSLLQGTRFISAHLIGSDSTECRNVSPTDHPPSGEFVARLQAQNRLRHDVNFYSNDATLVDGLAGFVEPTLKNGDVAVVIATESHRSAILQRLCIDGLNVASAIAQNRYISLDLADSFSASMHGGSVDPIQVKKGVRYLVEEAAKAAAERHLKIAVG